MGRYPQFRSESDVERRIKKLRGQGNGRDYSPWLFVQEVPSKGKSHKVPGIKTSGRTVHLLSNIEDRCHLTLEFSWYVKSIREQVALLPRGLSSRIADDLDIDHPTYPGTNVPQVLSTDLCAVLWRPDQPDIEVAISVKPRSKLKDPGTQELLLLERETNKALGREWYLFTDETVSKKQCLRLLWLRYAAQQGSNNFEITYELLDSFASAYRAIHEPGTLLKNEISTVSRRLDISADDALVLYKACGWHHFLYIDVFKQIGLNEPVYLLEGPAYVLRLSCIDASIGARKRHGIGLKECRWPGNLSPHIVAREK